ncbi:MAG TPA: hypothetical protein VFP72_18845 [Kineosporiaceae bacterium]|nr:hypothetical protein [Kineosporiaceae bacterium]
MDPVSLLIAALTAGGAAVATGATAGVTAATSNALVSLYSRLKDALAARFQGDQTSLRILERHAQNPAGYDGALRDVLTDTGAGADEALVDLARRLLEASDVRGATVGRYNVDVRDSKGIVIGDNAHVEQHFDN